MRLISLCAIFLSLSSCATKDDVEQTKLFVYDEESKIDMLIDKGDEECHGELSDLKYRIQTMEGEICQKGLKRVDDPRPYGFCYSAP